MGKKGDSDCINDGNMEKPVGKSATNKSNETESDDKKEEEKFKQKGQTTEKTNNEENEQKENNDEQKSVLTEECSKEWVTEKKTVNLSQMSLLKKGVVIGDKKYRIQRKIKLGKNNNR